MIILGGMLSRVITGAAPFIPVMGGTFTIIVIHRVLAWVCMYNHRIGNVIKGQKRILFVKGKIVETNMKKVLISKEDLEQGIRRHLNEHDTNNVDEIFIERDGELSVVKKQ